MTYWHSRWEMESTHRRGGRTFLIRMGARLMYLIGSLFELLLGEGCFTGDNGTSTSTGGTFLEIDRPANILPVDTGKESVVLGIADERVIFGIVDDRMVGCCCCCWWGWLWLCRVSCRERW